MNVDIAHHRRPNIGNGRLVVLRHVSHSILFFYLPNLFFCTELYKACLRVRVRFELRQTQNDKLNCLNVFIQLDFPFGLPQTHPRELAVRACVHQAHTWCSNAHFGWPWLGALRWREQMALLVRLVYMIWLKWLSWMLRETTLAFGCIEGTGGKRCNSSKEHRAISSAAAIGSRSMLTRTVVALVHFLYVKGTLVRFEAALHFDISIWQHKIACGRCLCIWDICRSGVHVNIWNKIFV